MDLYKEGMIWGLLSKNNRNELIRKQVPKRQRFTLKKLTIGVASVLIGFTFMGISASADTTTQPATDSQPVANANNDSTAGQNDQKTVVLSNKQQQPAVSKDASADQQTPVAKNEDNSNNTGSSENTQTANVSELGHGSTTGLNEMKPAVRDDASTKDVATWQQFVTQLSDKNITNITWPVTLMLTVPFPG